MLFDRWTGARIVCLLIKMMNAKIIVLPKRDLTYKPKLVSNDDW